MKTAAQKLSPKREVALIAAAMVIDNARGDRKFKCVESLGYRTTNPAVLTTAHMLHDLCVAGNDPEIVFAQEIAEYQRMEEEGKLALHRAALRETQVARNQPCPCGSGKKYKKCCLWNVESDGTAKKKGKAAQVLAAILSMLSMGSKGKKQPN